MGLVRLESEIQYYDWGDTKAIARVLGREESGRPEAELWMGAHARCPSPLSSKAVGCANLATLIQGDPVRFLGADVARRYGELPFLLKLLAAGSPLSLQAHPTQEQAQSGFAREESMGIPNDDPRRNYRDPHHKPELIYALDDFHALAGFRLPEKAAKLSADFLVNATPGVQALLSAFVQAPTEAGLEAYFRGLFALDSGELRSSIRAAVSQTPRGCPQAEAFTPWFRRLAEKYPEDPGVLASLLIRYFHLKPGQALFLGPGQLHSYLGGLGVELMASSDNVLRGGLSRKHIDVPELCHVLEFREGSAVPVSAERDTTGACTWESFATIAEEFHLSLFEGSCLDGQYLAPHGPEIWLGLDGELLLKSGGESELLAKGDQIFVFPENNLQLSGEGRAVRASMPPAAP